MWHYHSAKPLVTVGQNQLFSSYLLPDHTPHVLLHLVKSSCPNSVNPFSTLFSVDIKHNCPILSCICRIYSPPWLAFRFSIQKWLHLHFQGKWPLSPSSFEQMSFSLRFSLEKEWKCQIKLASLIVQHSNSASGWLAQFSRFQPQKHFIKLQHQLEIEDEQWACNWAKIR